MVALPPPATAETTPALVTLAYEPPLVTAYEIVGLPCPAVADSASVAPPT